jgi:hypothetical protein
MGFALASCEFAFGCFGNRSGRAKADADYGVECTKVIKALSKGCVEILGHLYFECNGCESLGSSGP